MLAVVSAVQTGNIIKHIQAERRMLIVAFGHINFARFHSFQHVFLSNLSKDNPQSL